MKKIKILMLLLIIAKFCVAQTVVDTDNDFVICQLSNPHNSYCENVPVVLTIKNQKFKSAVVLEGKIEVPSQLDIFDNGSTRELSFVIDLKAKQKKSLKIYFSESLADEYRYKPRVNAQMFLKVDGKNMAKDVISSDADNMYNKLHHHGPAFESELVAYRLYFDQKQTVDIYGKVVKRIELPETMWYPSDQQLIDKYGDDVLYVGGSVGVGTLKGWDGSKTLHIKDMAQREMAILAKGPVRTVVDLRVKGWKYFGRTINLHSRYILYAGHRDAEVCHTFSGDDVSDLMFATGVQKIRKGDVMHSDSKGAVADWGRDFPVTDTVKYPQQTIGLGVSIPAKYVISETTDPLNYLYTLKPVDNKISYSITMAAEKEEFGFKNSEEFFKYIDLWKEPQPIDVVIKVKKQ